ncbi:PA3496 family putative envelope integrity protein [Pseudoalteromonas nigrifaciens]|uniref:PA3496 family putative envelope integrity protein n=1 Tax=Pseudoalteromonas nigrifaciens TaxID=28109 RepID=UPI003F9C4E71
MANYEEYQNFTINPRKPPYTEEQRYRPVKATALKKGRARRNVEDYHEQRRIERESGLEYLFEEQP